MAYDAVPRPQRRLLEESILRSVALGDGSADAYSNIQRVQRSYQQDGMRSESFGTPRRNFSPYERPFEDRRPTRPYPGPRTVGPRYHDQPHRFHGRPGVRVTSGGSRGYVPPRRSTITSPRKPSHAYDTPPQTSTVGTSDEGEEDEEDDVFEDCSETLVGSNDLNGDAVVDSSIVIENLSARATKLKDLGQQTLHMTQAERTKLRMSSLQDTDTAGRKPRTLSGIPQARERGATLGGTGFKDVADSLHITKTRNSQRTRTIDATFPRHMSDGRTNTLRSTVTSIEPAPRPKDFLSDNRSRGHAPRRASFESLERRAKRSWSRRRSKSRSSQGPREAGHGIATVFPSSATTKSKINDQDARDRSDAQLAAKLLRAMEEHQNQSGELRQKKSGSPSRQTRGLAERDVGKSDLRKARAAINLLGWLADENDTKRDESGNAKQGRARRMLRVPRRKFRTIVNGMRLPYRRVRGLLSKDEPAAQLQNVLESTHKSRLGFRARLSFLKLAIKGRKPGEQKLIEMLDIPEPTSVVIEAPKNKEEPPVLQFREKIGVGRLQSSTPSSSESGAAKLPRYPQSGNESSSNQTWTTCEQSDGEYLAKDARQTRTLKRKNKGRLSCLDADLRERLYPKRPHRDATPPVPKIPEKYVPTVTKSVVESTASEPPPSPAGNMMNRTRPIRRQHDLPAISGGRTQIDTEELLYGAKRSPRAYREAQNNTMTPSTTEAGGWWNLWPIVKMFTEPISDTEYSRGGSVFSDKPTITEQKYQITASQADGESSVYSQDIGNQSGSEFHMRENGRRAVYVV